MTRTFGCALLGATLTIGAAQFAAAAPGDDFDICYRDSGDKAIEACTRAIDSGRYRGRDLAVLHSNRGTEWYEKQDYDRAMKDHDEAVRIDRTYASAYSNRGNVYSSRGQRERAIQDYDEAIRLDPRDAKALNNRGDEYTLLGQYDRALRDLDESIRIETNPVRYSNRCLVRAILGQAEQALADCNESLRMRPDSALVLGRRGFANFKLGQLDRAFADYEAALAIAPRQAFSLYGRGLVRLRNGDTAAANADFVAAKAARAAIAEDFVRYGVPADGVVQTAAPPAAAPTTTPAPPAAVNCARAETHWKSAETLKSVAIYEDHIARFPNCEFVTLAKARIEALKK